MHVMGFKDFLGIGSQIAQPIRAVSDLYTTDKARIEAQADYESIAQKPQLAQLETNRIFALSSHFFNSAWQPLVAWTAGGCLALYYVPQLIIADVIWGMNCYSTGVVEPFPINPDDLLQLIYLLFGAGSYHLVKQKLFDK